MATAVATDCRPYFGQLDLTAVTESVTFAAIEADIVTFTNFASGGFKEEKPGFLSGSMTVNVFEDYASGALDDTVGLTLGAQYPFTGVIPSTPGTEAAGDLAYLSRGVLKTYSPRQGAAGEAAKASIDMPFDTRVVRGVLLHPKTARTTTSAGDAVALTGPTSSQTLWATLHVTAFSGLTNIVVKIQSDDNSNFTSAADKVTFSTVTGVGAQFTSVAGGWDTETHVRASWTVSGTGSCSFVVACGVL